VSINTRTNKTPRLARDFEFQLDRQLKFMNRSCADFDKGEYDEAIRIALTIRVLVHDTRQSTSLLTHMGIKETLSYVDTGVYRSLLDPATQTWVNQISPGSVVAASSPVDVGLVELGDAGGGRVGWFAPLRLQRFKPGTLPAKATRGASPFDVWWNDPLVESSNQKSFSRSNLILIMANQDGGGHVDASLDKDYKDLILDPLMQAEHGSFVEDKTMGGDIPDALHNVAFASVRQIAFELVTTLERYNYVKSNPGVLAMADPFNGLPIPSPPHRLMNLMSPMVIGKPA
jgi:hypothetical protein